ncbi:hypothetical protein [Sphaerimonospora thailandensis]|nr:hypothetical protein [Sphaerimonospora thailandensis]
MRRSLREAEQFSGGIVRLLESALLPEYLRPDVERACDQAKLVLSATRDPYVVGILGEFSAGKTMFIASLLGLLDDLAIGDRPTTGNVTAFWVRQGPAKSSSAIVGVRVTYLSAAEVRDCREKLGAQLREAAGRTNSLVTEEFDGAVREASSPTGNGRQLRHWYDTHAAACPDEVGRLTTQLVAIASAAAEFTHLLGRRDEPVVLQEAAPLLTISDARSTSESSSMAADRFWIVRHVTITVEVPPEILDLDRLVGEAPWTGGSTQAQDLDRLVIYDFPGFLNHISGERDLRLTETMLPEMDTVVALLKAANADGPASDHLGHLFRDVFAKDRRRGRVLVGVGNVSDVPEIGRLASPAARHAEREDDLLRQLPTLKELLDTADRLSPEEEPFLYSGLVALKRLGLAGSLDHRADEADGVARSAGDAAESLPQVSRLKPLLAALAHDGGREAVVSRLQDRLAEHGLVRRYERVRRERDRLDGLLNGLETRLEQAPQDAWASADADVMRLLDRTEGVLTSLISDIPTMLADTLTMSPATGGQSIVEDIRATITAKVLAWPEWWQILSTTAGAEVRGGPETTEAFLPQFKSTCHSAYRAAHRQILLQWEEAVIAKAERSLPLDVRTLAERPELSPKNVKRARLLTHPAEWHGMLMDVADDIAAAEGDGTLDDVFPLRRPHRFAWAIAKTDRPPIDDGGFAHQLHPGHVLRLRHELVGAATAAVQGRIDALRPSAAQNVGDFLKSLERVLSKLRSSLTSTPTTPAQEKPLLDELRRLRESSGQGKGTLRDLISEAEAD